MSATPLYYPPNPQFPTIVKAIVESLLMYICNNIYPVDAVQDIAKTIRDRIFLADIEEGEDKVMTQTSRYMNVTNTKFPFTAYNIGPREIDTTQNTFFAAGGFQFVEGIGYCHAVPMKLTLPLITFFNRAEDFNIAYTSFIVDNAAVTRVPVSIVIGGYTVKFTIDVTYSTLQQGTYAAHYQEWLRVNNLWDIQHTAEISYYEYMFTGEGNSISSTLTGKAIFGGLENRPEIVLVDPHNLYVNLFGKGDDDFIYFQEQAIVPEPPVVTASTPANNATGISVSAPLTLTFSNSMKEGTVESAISYAPNISADYSWSADSKILTITPRVNMQNLTQYTLLLNKDVAKDKNTVKFVNDFELKFTTI